MKAIVLSLVSSAILPHVFLATAQSPEVDASLRAGIWSSTRLADDEMSVVNSELWLRASAGKPERFTFTFEGYAGVDPTATGTSGGDVRDAFFTATFSETQVRAGRMVLPWGRADRINPTDVVSARDWRRLVTDEAENRLGLAAIEVRTPLGPGDLSAYWFPEFRALRLPLGADATSQLRTREPVSNEAVQGAVRYEVFASAFDASVTVAHVMDRTAWLTLSPQRQVIETHPFYTMVGGDIAASAGAFNLRAEAASYDYEGVQTGANRIPSGAITVGADRDFADGLNVNAQLVARFARTADGSAALPVPLTRANDVSHLAWRDTITGATLRIRKAFAQDRGSVEVSGLVFAGGGHTEEIKLSWSLRDSIRLELFAQQFDGPDGSALGRFAKNSLVTIGLKRGF